MKFYYTWRTYANCQKNRGKKPAFCAVVNGKDEQTVFNLSGAFNKDNFENILKKMKNNADDEKNKLIIRKIHTWKIWHW